MGEIVSILGPNAQSTMRWRVQFASQMKLPVVFARTETLDPEIRWCFLLFILIGYCVLSEWLYSVPLLRPFDHASPSIDSSEVLPYVACQQISPLHPWKRPENWILV